MNRSRESQSDINVINERLAKAFYANGRYNPHFLVVAGFGFLTIYILTRAGILGEPAPQLAVIGILTILLAAVEAWPTLWFARRRRGIAANFSGSIAVGIYCIALTILWQGILPAALLIAIIVPAIAIRTGMQRKQIAWMLLVALAAVGGIIFAEKNPITQRLQSGYPASIASFAFLGATALLLITITVISQNKSFKKLQNLLLLSFVVIVTVPTVMAAILSAVGTFTNSETQTFSTLKAITRLKESQISTLIDRFENDTHRIQDDSEFYFNALNILKNKDSEPALMTSNKSFTRNRMVQIISIEEEAYKEVMVLSTEGDVLVSTIADNEGQNFQDQLFFPGNLEVLCRL